MDRQPGEEIHRVRSPCHGDTRQPLGHQPRTPSFWVLWRLCYPGMLISPWPSAIRPTPAPGLSPEAVGGTETSFHPALGGRCHRGREETHGGQRAWGRGVLLCRRGEKPRLPHAGFEAFCYRNKERRDSEMKRGISRPSRTRCLSQTGGPLVFRRSDLKGCLSGRTLPCF